MYFLKNKLFFNIFFISLCLSFVILTKNNIFDSLLKYNEKKILANDNDEEKEIKESFSKIIGNIESLMSNLIALSISNASDPNISPNDTSIIKEAQECQESYSIFYNFDNKNENDTEAVYYLLLLYYDSSKSKNDLGSYTDCTKSQTFPYNKYNITEEEKELYKENSTYLVVQINEQKNCSFADISYQENEYLIGLCIKKGCSERVVKKTLVELNKEITFFEEFGYNDIEVYDLDGKKLKEKKYIFCWIPYLIIFILVIFSFFKCGPNLVFSKIHPRKANDLKDCFNLKNNHEEIFGNFQENENIVSNDTGLTIIKGLRGINMISVLVSISFFYIYHLPTKIYNKDTFQTFITSYWFTLVYYGARFGIKILYAMSGYELVYKMLNYLDNSIENKEKVLNIKESDDLLYNVSKDSEEDDDETSDKKNKENQKDLLILKDKKINKSKTSSSENIMGSEETDENEENEENKDLIEEEKKNSSKKTKKKVIKDDFEFIDLTNEEQIKIMQSINKELYLRHRANLEGKILFNFILKQWHRYAMFIFAVIIFKYGVIKPLLLFTDPSPMWILYLRQIADKFETIHIFSNIFCFSPFSYYTYNQIDPFGMVYNEIIFFIIGSILIFYSYKYCLRLDLITIYVSIFFLLLKIGIYFIFLFISNNDENYNFTEIDLTHGFYPLMFFQYNEENLKIKSFLLSNQLLNIPSFLIGILFGEMNYCIQNFAKANDKNKKYLNIPKKLLNYYSRMKKMRIFYIILYFILLILSIFTYMICIKITGVEKPEDFFINKWYNLIGLIDTDFGVLFHLLCVILLSLSGDNIVVNFLKHKYWGILSRTYWTFLITLHICACFIFYLSENRIKLIFYNVIFFSFELLMVVIIVVTLIFICIEIPFKKLNKIFIKNRDEELFNYKNK